MILELNHQSHWSSLTSIPCRQSPSLVTSTHVVLDHHWFKHGLCCYYHILWSPIFMITSNIIDQFRMSSILLLFHPPLLHTTITTRFITAIFEHSLKSFLLMVSIIFLPNTAQSSVTPIHTTIDCPPFPSSCHQSQHFNQFINMGISTFSYQLLRNFLLPSIICTSLDPPSSHLKANQPPPLLVPWARILHPPHLTPPSISKCANPLLDPIHIGVDSEDMGIQNFRDWKRNIQH